MMANDRHARPSPYVGPPAFKYGQILHGRDREVLELLDLLVSQRIVLLYSPSGAGKSSLINAALIDKLKDNQFRVLPVIRVGLDLPVGLTDTDAVNRYLLSALVSLEEGQSKELQLHPDRLARMEFAEYLEHRAHSEADERSIVLIFDQFEEIVAGDPTDRESKRAFFEQVGIALRDPNRWALFSMREEYSAALEPYLGLIPTALSTTYRLDRLSEQAALLAVQKPALAEGVDFKDAAAQQLVKELRRVQVRRPDGITEQRLGLYVEPVQLQVVCVDLWERLDKTQATVVNQEDVTDSRTVDQALSDFYENALQAASRKTGTDVDALRAWFEEFLITPTGTRGMAYQGAAKTGRGDGGIPNSAVKILEEEHVIRFEERAGGERWYELAHDRFIAPILKANGTWRRQREENDAKRDARRRLLRRLLPIAAVLIAVAVAAAVWYRELWRTEGQIKDLVALNDRDPKEAALLAPAVIDNVAGYLWQKGTDRSIEKLAELLELADPLIPAHYGLDPMVAVVTPTGIGTKHPALTVTFHPSRQADPDILRYHWRIMARELARQWGIVSPMVLRIRTDKNLSFDRIMVTGESEKAGSELAPIEGHLDEIPTLPGVMLVTEKGMEDMDDRRLPEWFARKKSAWTKVGALIDGGPWWLVPKWTAPLFKVAGHPADPQEAAVAVAVAKQILKQPEMVVSRKSVAHLLERMRDQGYSLTVDEALRVRGGLDGIVEDLRSIVRDGQSLLGLEYILDSLAVFPRPEFSSHRIAKRWAKTLTSGAAPAAEILGGASEPTEPSFHEVSSDDLAPYREAGEFLVKEPPIHVYFSKNLAAYFLNNPHYFDKIAESWTDAVGAVYKRFGVMAPLPKLAGVLEGGGGKNAFRIEILNQTRDNEDAQPIGVADPDEAIAMLERELLTRFRIMRDWWITTKSVQEELNYLPKGVQEWLGKHFSTTDIKSLLRTTVAPTDEISQLSDGPSDQSLGDTAPGHSLRHLPWLLESLVFWVQVEDPRNGRALAERLQETQRSLRNPQTAEGLPEAVTDSIAAGIGALDLDEQDIDQAERRFSEALEQDRPTAIKAFLANYSRRSQVTPEGELASFKKVCDYAVRPGQLAQRRSIDHEIRFQIEDYLATNDSRISANDRALLELCLLEHYVVQDYRIRARALLDRLVNAEHGEWSPEQRYATAYWVIDLEGSTTAQPEAQDLSTIERLLREAFQGWTAEAEPQAVAAFSELLQRYPPEKWLPAWYADLMERLAALRQDSYWIPYRLGERFAVGRSVEQASKAVELIDQADKRLSASKEPEATWPELRSWQILHKTQAYLTMAFQGGPAERLTRLTRARQSAMELIASLVHLENVSRRNLCALKRAAYEIVVQTYLFANDVNGASDAMKKMETELPESVALLSKEIFLALLRGDGETALEMARKIRQAIPDKTDDAGHALECRTNGGEEAPCGSKADRNNALFEQALVNLVVGGDHSRYTAREFLNTAKHEYLDYIRLMLYWALQREGKPDEAKALLEERWNQVDPGTWDRRLEEGDPGVWRDMFAGYYLGQVTRAEIFGPLRDRQAFEASPISRIGVQGLSFDGMRAEAHFYDALLQDVSGKSSTRKLRYREALEQVIAVGSAGMYEYAMAKYLLGESPSGDRSAPGDVATSEKGGD